MDAARIHIAGIDWIWVGCDFGHCNEANKGVLVCVFDDRHLKRRDTEPIFTSKGPEIGAANSAACTPPGIPNADDEQSEFINTLKAAFAYERARYRREPVILNWNTALEGAAKEAAGSCHINFNVSSHR
jgi:hypothetical protein